MNKFLILLFAIVTSAFAEERPKLQIFNGSTEPVDIFWLKSESERVPNGSLEPEKDTVLTTTIGHRFAVVGRTSRTETVVTSEVPIQGFRAGGVPAFYTQRADAHGFPVVASAKVNPYALKEAVYLIDLMLAKRTDVRDALIKSGARMCILGHAEFTCDLPEFARFAKEPMRGFAGISGRDYWDARARGTGGSQTDPLCTSAEENLLGYPGDPYEKECILIHEFAHCIHLRGMTNVDPTFDKRLKSTYDAAMKAGLWKGKYASVNHAEYWAEGVQSWFDNNRVNDHDHNHVHLRSQLIEYDPGLAALCREVFGDTEVKYTKPATRLNAHMEGYDPAKAPTFVWPERLKEAKKAISTKVKERTDAANKPKPNILFIFNDDQRADTIAALGNPVIKTPNLDRLCRQGVAFNRAYMQGGFNGATCVPSRAMLLSGRSLFHVDEKLADETWPAAFGRSGYTTFATGKWHNGVKSLAASFQTARSIFANGMTNPLQAPLSDLENGSLTPPKKGSKHACEQFADEAVAFLKSHKSGPFLCYVAFDGPHDPHIVPEDYPVRYTADARLLPPNFLPLHPFNNGEMTIRDEVLLPHPRTPEGVQEMNAEYYRYISFLDMQIGRILDALAASPAAANTIIVFAADSGVARGSHGLIGKQNLYEHSVRVPLIISGPGIASDKRTEAMCYLFDVMPTLGAMCGVTAPKTSEGIDLRETLRDPGHPARKELVFGYRQVQRSIRDDRWKLIRYPQVNRTQLFDLQNDPQEKKDLFGTGDFAAKATELSTRLEVVLKACDDKCALSVDNPKPADWTPPSKGKKAQKKNTIEEAANVPQ